MFYQNQPDLSYLQQVLHPQGDQPDQVRFFYMTYLDSFIDLNHLKCIINT